MSEISFGPRWNPTVKEQIEILRWFCKRKNYDLVFGRFRREWIQNGPAKRNEKYPNDSRLSNTEWINAVYNETIRPTGNG